jgi:hypothetical protein
MSLSLDITSIDAGAVAGREEFVVVLTNDGETTVSVTAIDVPAFTEGLFISGDQPPFNLAADASKSFTLIVRPVGARLFSGSWVFRTASDSVTVSISGERKTLWPFAHNWASSFEMTTSFKTDIFASRGGKERRVSQRHQPVRSVALSPLCKADQFRTFDRLMANALASVFVVEDPTKSTALDTGASGSELEVVEAEPWLVAGAHVVLSGTEAAQISDVDGTTVTLTRALSSSHATGAKVSNAWLMRASPSQTQMRTDHVMTGQLEFAELSGISGPVGAGSQETTFNGREVFPWPYNWAAGQGLSIDHLVDHLDHGFGVSETLHPVDFAARRHKVDLLLQGAQILRLEQFFARMRGRAGEFYVTSGLEDIVLTEGQEVAASRTIRVTGTELYDRLASDTVHLAIEAKTPAGVERFQVAGLSKSGGNTLILLGADWTANPSTWLKISWLFAARFAGDDLLLDFQTASVATTSLTIQALEDL